MLPQAMFAKIICNKINKRKQATRARPCNTKAHKLVVLLTHAAAPFAVHIINACNSLLSMCLQHARAVLSFSLTASLRLHGIYFPAGLAGCTTTSYKLCQRLQTQHPPVHLQRPCTPPSGLANTLIVKVSVYGSGVPLLLNSGCCSHSSSMLHKTACLSRFTDARTQVRNCAGCCRPQLQPHGCCSSRSSRQPQNGRAMDCLCGALSNQQAIVLPA
ncbi:hypothetical protein COO60DRAFT_143909 [Scenedesmus sp. NREL 46B-D3]|nr:hypothetical protein COO60DRAFT_143909 [Scenedesmus sp. NREL 46B-D3]